MYACDVGNDSLASELRLRTVVELAAFCDEYEDKYKNNHFTELCGVSVQETTHEMAVDGGLASVWSMCALAPVVERSIVSLYPNGINGCNDLIPGTLNVTFSPRVDPSS